MIAGFQGEFRYLSNFWLATVVYEGYVWPSVEHAYQWAKSSDPSRVGEFCGMTPGQTKRAGRDIPVDVKWHSTKVAIMRRLVLDKFRRTPDLAAALIATGERDIVELNWHGDEFWGVVQTETGELRGRNELGKILMHVRDVLQERTIEFS